MTRIVVTGRIPEPGIEVLRAEGHEVMVWHEPGPMPRETFLAEAANADALITLLTERVDTELLEAAGPRLRAVCNVAVGYNNIDVAACRARGVVATNTPGVLTDTTADLAMALILMVTRRLGEGERLIRSGEPWQWSMFMMLGTSIQGMRLGIVGLGQIGTAVARRARAFGMSIAYANRTAAPDAVVEQLGAVRLDLDDLVRTSDIVSLHCPYTPETHHLFDGRRLELMRRSAFLVNTSRGPVVDEAALVVALEKGQIAGAALDVFEREPEVHPGLVGRNDVVLVPHLGSATVQTRAAMATLAARNAVAILAGQPPITPIGA